MESTFVAPSLMKIVRSLQEIFWKIVERKLENYWNIVGNCRKMVKKLLNKYSKHVTYSAV